MKTSDLGWSEDEDYLATADIAVLLPGSTEQSAGMSLSLGSIVSGKLALLAFEPLGVPVFPVLVYGVTPCFTAYT